MNDGFTKKDWALFRSKLPDWQEAYMERLCREYVKLLTKKADASDRFWELDKRIRRDRKKAGVQIEMSRSNMVFNLMSLLQEGAISLEDLDEFSDELKETVQFFMRRFS